MLNKSAIIANAKKLTSKGQLDKAIAEYQKLLEENHDGNLFNTVGDLQVRKGDEEAAIESYTSAASIYKKDGFYPKATALYKKILNIRPTEVSALIALATLDAERGLKGNAIECYLKAAEIYYREGAKEKVLMTIDRALQLSPSDIETRLRIADVYLKAGTKQRAANEYASVASSCAEKQAYDQARELLKKASELDPENVQTFIGLSRLAALTGDEEAAFQYLVQAMSQDGCDKKCAELFLEMAIQTGNQEIAEKMLGAQLQKNPSNIFISNLLAKMHMEDGNIDAAWVLLAPAIDRELSNDNSEAALEMLEPFAELKSLPVLQRLVTAYRGLDNTEGLKEAL
ncbi:hypothetical protein H8E50_04085, partial [bacterium]|nr:hypothetical protein [bacterium]